MNASEEQVLKGTLEGSCEEVAKQIFVQLIDPLLEGYLERDEDHEGVRFAVTTVSLAMCNLFATVNNEDACKKMLHDLVEQLHTEIKVVRTQAENTKETAS